MKQDKNKNSKDKKNYSSNKDWQGVDKPPEEERKKAEKVTKDDLKNKKTDADPEQENKIKPLTS